MKLKQMVLAAALLSATMVSFGVSQDFWISPTGNASTAHPAATQKLQQVHSDRVYAHALTVGDVFIFVSPAELAAAYPGSNRREATTVEPQKLFKVISAANDKDERLAYLRSNLPARVVLLTGAKKQMNRVPLVLSMQQLKNADIGIIVGWSSGKPEIINIRSLANAYIKSAGQAH
jgi:hypothetical protein